MELNKAIFDLYRKTILDFCGIQIADEAQTEFARRIEERMRQVGSQNYYEYHSFVSAAGRGEDELRKLVELITNNETYFFREPSHFQLLKNRIVPEILKTRRQVRVWSAGCSTGEEVCTLAITLLEAQSLQGPFEAQVLGTDIDRTALTVAKLGNYSRNSFRAIESYYLQNYFQIPDQRILDFHTVDERVQKMTRYEYLNLFESPYPEFVKNMDVVFFRNVSIYFPKDVIEKVHRKIVDCLVEGGYLFLSASETLHHNFGYLELVERDGVFVFQKNSDRKSRPVTKERASHESKEYEVGDVPPPKPSKKEESIPTLDQIFSLYKNGDYGAVLANLTKWESKWDNKIPFLILKSFVYIGQERFKDAEIVNDAILQGDAINVDGFFLKGLVAYHQKKEVLADSFFQKAIFLKKDTAMAHYYLGLIKLNAKMATDARREFKNTIKILEAKKDMSWSFLATGYSSDYIIKACKQHLK